MPIRRSWPVLLVLLLPTVTHADDHRADAYGGWSYASGSALFGFHHTIAVTLPRPETRDLSALADVSVHFGSLEDDDDDDGADVTRVTVLGGVRWGFGGDSHPPVVPFAHVLAGVVADHAGARRDTDPALAFGAGIDYIPARTGGTSAARNALQQAGGWGVRAQVDYIVRPDDSFPRVSAGVMYRFHRIETARP